MRSGYANLRRKQMWNGVMKKKLDREAVLDMVRGFQPACVVIAAAEMEVFTILSRSQHLRPQRV